jgi:transglutaminase-like putative cysteine protease
MTERLDDRQFELLCAASVATLLAHIAHLPPWLWLPLAILLPLRAWTRRQGAQKFGAWIRLPLTALLLVLVLANFGNVFGREPGSVLGCGLLGLKLLEAERVRDARVALGFAAFVLMSALLFTQTLLFSVAVCAVLVLQVAALVSLQPAPLEPRRPLRAQFRLAALLLGAGLPLAAAGFVLVPRLGSPLWGSPGNDTAARSGISDSMAPGGLIDLLIDDSPAFRVDFGAAPPPPQQRYFRTLVLWDFDGTTWSRQYGRGLAAGAEVAEMPSPALDYTVTLEATNQAWLPALDLPLSAPENARLGSDRTLVAGAPVTQPYRYRVQSATTYMLAPTLSARQRARALALPDGFDPKAHALAERWRAEGRDDEAVVRAALDLFHESFTYTLSPPALGRDSVDDFLFGTQKGFCEHYSSAFVVLMRAAGIPARVVTGYQGGWWNKSDSYLLVRQSDAHAWAETWMPGRGWQRVDPTAAVSPSRIERGAAAANGNAGWGQAAWLRDLRDRFDFANRLWTDGIIRYNALRQKSMLTPFGIDDANQGDLLLVLSTVLGVAMLLATIWAMRSGSGPKGDALDRAWSQMRRHLARSGLGARANEGPLDWLQRLRGSAPMVATELAPLVDDYAALRYGADAPDPARVAAFAGAVRRWRMRSLVKGPK